MVKKFQMKRQDLNSKKKISAILEFSILREKSAKFRKIRIFEHIWVFKNSMVKKLRMTRLDLNKK